MSRFSHASLDLITSPWSDYELLDSGENQKLERYGSVTIIRPEPQAIWKRNRAELWAGAHAEFDYAAGKGIWRKKKDVPESWEIAWQDLRFIIRLTSFKHTGIFPEQAPNWEWVGNLVRQGDRPHILNLFGYTGVASVVAAKYGARVTHVDASGQSIGWARENAKLASSPDDGIRYMLDDALKFVRREGRRGTLYDGIILDPPAFGRGPKGEMWKIEESLPLLVEALQPILSTDKGSFFLLNGYAAGYTPRSFLQLTQSVFSGVTCEYGELGIYESSGERSVSSGIYTRFIR